VGEEEKAWGRRDGRAETGVQVVTVEVAESTVDVQNFREREIDVAERHGRGVNVVVNAPIWIIVVERSEEERRLNYWETSV